MLLGEFIFAGNTMPIRKVDQSQSGITTKRACALLYMLPSLKDKMSLGGDTTM